MSTTFIVENRGYPVNTYLKVSCRDQECEPLEIVQIDMYADAQLKNLICDDIDVYGFSKEDRQNIEHAIFKLSCAEIDRKHRITAYNQTLFAGGK